MKKLERESPELVAQLPRWVWIQLSMGWPITLRPPTELVPARTPRGEPALQAHIYTSRYTGDDVAARFIRDEDARRQQIEPQPDSAPSMYLDITFVKEPSQLQTDYLVPAVPHVVVTVGFPPPSARTIANAYDGYLRDHPWLALELGGGRSNEDKNIAIRTWAIGLLMREGLTFARAVRELEPVMGYFDYSQEADRQARKRLIERVPEAAPYLSASKVRTGT
jgi:hypothetical protein